MVLRGVWDFLTQPTEPLFPATIKPIVSEVQAVSANRTIVAPTSSSPPSPSSSLVRAELLGIIGAIAVVQSVRWILRIQQIRQESERRQQAAEERRRERIKFLVESLRLTKHPEGGFYRRIFESSWMLMKGDALRNQSGGTAAAILPKQLQQDQSEVDPRSFHFPRHLHTSIYFLLTHDEPLSHLHRLPADEQWIHVEGDPLLISHIDPTTNNYSERLLGQIDHATQVADGDSIDKTQPNFPAVSGSSTETIFLEPCSTAPIVDVRQEFQKQANLSTSSVATPNIPLPSLCYPTHVVPGGTWFGARWVERTSFVSPPIAPASTNIWLRLSKFLSRLCSFERSGETAVNRSKTGKPFGYSLVCCVVTPGFEFSDFALMGLQQFEELNIEQQLRDRLLAAKVGSIEAQQSKIQRVREMVLHEETRGDAMAVEGNLLLKSQSS